MYRDDPNQRFGQSFHLGPSLANVSAHAERRQRWVRLARATVAIGIILAVGTYGYWYLGDAKHSVIEALYMTVISISTVGFTEVIPITTDVMRIFTMSLILLGGASVVYFLTAVAAFVIEGDVLYGFWRRRLQARLKRARGHVIVAGLGRVGAHAFSELFPSRVDAVGIDLQPDRIESLIARHGEGVVFAVGEAFDERTLRAVGVERAHALIACLPDDRDNFLLGVTARQLAPDVRLLFRVVDPDNTQMFSDLTPEAAVHPPVITGRRVANTLLRSEMLAFTDALLAAETRRKVLIEVVVDARLVKRRIGELKLRRGTPHKGSDDRIVPTDPPSDLYGHDDPGPPLDLIVGHRRPGDFRFSFHPAPHLVLERGDVLLVLTDRRRVAISHIQDTVALRVKRLVPSPFRKVSRVVPRPTIAPGAKVDLHPPLRSRLSKAHPTTILPVPTASSGGTDDSWRGHIVVAGAGAVGRGIVDALLAAGQNVCVIEREGSRRDHWPADPHLRFVTGDVFSREALTEASITTARAFVSALQSLRDNLFLCAFVRHSNEKVRIVARVGNGIEARRLRSVGANTFNPGEIGGVHLARLAIHPEMVTFADGLEATLERTEQLSFLVLPERSKLVGQTLAQAELQARTGCVIIGLRTSRSGPFLYHPSPERRLRRATCLIALGESQQLDRLTTLMSLSS